GAKVSLLRLLQGLRALPHGLPPVCRSLHRPEVPRQQGSLMQRLPLLPRLLPQQLPSPLRVPHPHLRPLPYAN
ncbi:hypothetical protein AX14_011637, partial [Amanita brunnescens Koide BX004]